MWLGWIAAGLSQVMPAILCALTLGALLRYEHCKSKFYLVAAVILAITLGQFNFVAPLSFTLVMGFRLLYVYVTSRNFSRISFYLMVLTMLGALFNFFAPGTTTRSTKIAQNQDLLNFDYVSSTSKLLYKVFLLTH